jgi:ORF6N domain
MPKPNQPSLQITEQLIVDRVFVIRGVKVMLDKDLADLYSVNTSALNQAVKRNLPRFPDDFMFQLSQKEFDSLISQSVISKQAGRGGTRSYLLHLPNREWRCFLLT